MACLLKKDIYDSDESDFRDDDYDEEDDMENIPVKGLFNDKIYNNITDMFKSEFQEKNFDLIKIIQKYNMSQIDYIKMINFIRSKVMINHF